MALFSIDSSLYTKHHNIIDGIYFLRNAYSWEEIPHMDEIDADDDSGELLELLKDVKLYNIESIPNFILPTDPHNLTDYIFVIIRNGEFYLCETQFENYIKFATNISKVNFIKKIPAFLIHERTLKLKNIQNGKSNL